MNPRLSLLLDLMRLLAALAVLCTHLSHLLVPEVPVWASRHGQEAVSIFFVLSGFVIAYSCEQRAGDWRDYAAARAARLYSVVIPCLLAAIVIDGVGSRLNPGWYETQSFMRLGPSPATLLPTAFFTNELWFSHVVIGSAEPFWSLGFEVPYYLLFAILLFSTGTTRIVLALGWAVLVGPKILLYLPLWLAGVFTWWTVRSDGARLDKRAAWALLLLLPLAYVLWNRRLGAAASAQFEWVSTQDALFSAGYHMVIALIVAAVIVALSVVSRGLPPFRESLAGPIRWLAGGSFTLYLLHQPLIAFAAATVSPLASLASRLGVVAVIIGIIFLVASVGERRKCCFARHIRLLMGWHGQRETVPARANSA